MDIETCFIWMCQLRQLWMALLFIWLVDRNLALTMLNIQWGWDVLQVGFSGHRNWHGVWGAVYFLRINPSKKKEKLMAQREELKYNTVLSHPQSSQWWGSWKDSILNFPALGQNRRSSINYLHLVAEYAVPQERGDFGWNWSLQPK